MKYTITCPCLFGIESELKFEIGKIGGEDILAEDGRVTFTGDETMVAKANLYLSTAERVLLRMAEFDVYSFEDLFQGVKAVHWEDIIPSDGEFPVTGHCKNSVLASVSDCQAITKKAMADRLSNAYGVSWCEESGDMYKIRFIIMKNRASIYLDTTGVPLHKRGYRSEATIAPIKETLAAGIVRLARVGQDSVVYDPFCGSGTILIESAMKALSIAPGIGRHFACERWEHLFPKSIFTQLKQQAYTQVNRTALFSGIGSDIDPQAVMIASGNCKKQGLAAKIRMSQSDIKNFVLPNVPGGIIISNPPYGERMLEQKQCREIYRTMGQVLGDRTDTSMYIITSDDEFENCFGRRADRKRKLYNGMIKCNLYMYYKK